MDDLMDVSMPSSLRKSLIHFFALFLYSVSRELPAQFEKQHDFKVLSGLSEYLLYPFMDECTTSQCQEMPQDIDENQTIFFHNSFY